MTASTKVTPTFPHYSMTISVVTCGYPNIGEMKMNSCGACYALVPEMSWGMHAAWHYENDNRLAELQALVVAPINDGSDPSDPA